MALFPVCILALHSGCIRPGILTAWDGERHRIALTSGGSALETPRCDDTLVTSRGSFGVWPHGPIGPWLFGQKEYAS